MQSVASVGFEMLNNSGLCVGVALKKRISYVSHTGKAFGFVLSRFSKYGSSAFVSSMAACAVTATLPTVKVAVRVTNTNWFVFSAAYKFVKEELDGKVIV